MWALNRNWSERACSGPFRAPVMIATPIPHATARPTPTGSSDQL